MRPTRASEAGVLVGLALGALLSQVVACTSPADYYYLVVGCEPGYTCIPIPVVPPPADVPPDDYPDATPVETTAPVPDGATVRELDYRVVDAAFDMKTGRIVVVSDAPRELVVIDADGLTETRYALPANPTAVRVSADGRLAAVGYDTGVSVVQLDTGTSSPVCSQVTSVTQVAITGEARVFTVSSPSPDDQMGVMTILDGNTCAVLLEAGAGAGAGIALSRSEASLYLDDGLFERCTVDASSATGLSSCDRTDVPSCAGFWLERGESELYTRCAERFRLAEPDQESHSELAAGNLGEIDQVVMASASTAADRVLVLGTSSAETDPSGTRVLRVYDSTYLDPRAIYGLPPLPAATDTVPSYGRFVFLDATLQHALVFVQSAPGSAALHEFGLARLPLPHETGGAGDAGDAADSGDTESEADASAG